MSELEIRSRWLIANGEIVTVGDTVALDISPDSYGQIVGSNDYGIPTVEITDGPRKGKTVVASPGQMLSKRGKRPNGDGRRYEPAAKG